MWGNTVGRIKTPRRRYDGMEAISSPPPCISLSLPPSPAAALVCLYIGSRRSKSEPSLSLASTPLRLGNRPIVTEIAWARWMMTMGGSGCGPRRRRLHCSPPPSQGGLGGRCVTDINVTCRLREREKRVNERWSITSPACTCFILAS